MPRKPTAKQKAFADKYTENAVKGLGKTKKEIAMEAGYSEATALSVDKLENSKTMAELIRERMPDDKTVDLLDELTNTRKLDFKIFPAGYEDEQIIDILHDENPTIRVTKIIKSGPSKRAYYWIRDNSVAIKALDMRIKITGDYAGEKLTITNPLRELDDSELDAQLKAMEQEQARRRKN